MTNSYDDIIHHPHHVSATRPHMSVIDRAAQFSPFAALTGYDAAIKETARLTDKRVDLDEYMKDTLSDKLQVIADRMKKHPEIAITYFQPDRNIFPRCLQRNRQISIGDLSVPFLPLTKYNKNKVENFGVLY